MARALRRAGAKTALSMPTWTEDSGSRGRTLYLDAVLDKRILQAQGLTRAGLEYKEYGVDGQYAGFFCPACRSSLSGWRPGYRRKPASSNPRRAGPFT
ncbi:MAG: hypothetical protein HY924_03830 [Elusimicrobia bacterium]|nr:hypothetical protein [Elusimicrobiota bacterium]